MNRIFAATILFLGISLSTGKLSEAYTQLPPEGAAVRDMMWSFSGEYLASANPSGNIYIHDVADNLIRVFAAHQPDAITLTWSPDDRYLATGGDDSNIQVWDINTGTLVRSVPAFVDGVFNLAWQPTGDILLASGFSQFQAWNTADWTEGAFNPGVTLLDLAWSPDGSQFAYAFLGWVGVADFDSSPASWNKLTPEVFRPRSVAWNAAGTQLVSTSEMDNLVRVWDALAGEEIAAYPQPAEFLLNAAFVGADSEWIAVSTAAGQLRLISAEDGGLQAVVPISNRAWSLAYNPVHDLLAVGGWESAADEATPQPTLIIEEATPIAVTLAPDAAIPLAVTTIDIPADGGYLEIFRVADLIAASE